MKRFTLIDRTEFRLLQRILNEGPAAVRPVLAQRRDLGFNCARVLSQTDLMFTLHPRDYPAAVYDGAVHQMIELLAEYGSYVNFVAYADERNIQSGPSHWNRLGAIMQQYPGCGILSGCNEADITVNAVPFLSQLQKIPGVICTRGSHGGSTNMPPLPHMDAAEVHSNGQSEWWRKNGHNPMEDIAWTAHIPAWMSEQPRPDQDPNVGRHADSGGIGALLSAGATFHCSEGKVSELFGFSLTHAQAFVARMRGVPEHMLTGSPTPGLGAEGHYDRVDDSSVLRRYRKTLPDGRSWEETARLP